MSSQLAQLQEATIKQHCKTLRMPMMASQFSTLAEQAVREKKTHTGYLEVLLTTEIEERERNTIDRRIKEAHLPRVKTLEEFDYTQAPLVTAAQMRDLAEGGYIERAEPVLLIGECGTGKTHLLTGLCVAASADTRPRPNRGGKAIVGQGKRTYTPAWAWPRVGRSGVCGLPPQPP